MYEDTRGATSYLSQVKRIDLNDIFFDIQTRRDYYRFTPVLRDILLVIIGDNVFTSHYIIITYNYSVYMYMYIRR